MFFAGKILFYVPMLFSYCMLLSNVVISIYMPMLILLKKHTLYLAWNSSRVRTLVKLKRPNYRTIDPSALEKESLTSDIKAKKSTKKRKPKQPFQYGTISSSATRYTESVLVISDSYASLTLDTGNLGTPGIQVTNLPLTTIKEACVVVSDFAASSSLASSMVTKIFIRLGTHELLKGYVLDLLLKDVSDLLKLLKRLYKEASIFVCSLLPVEDKMYSSQTRENVTVFNSWLYSSCDPSMKIYYLNFYALFISSYGKNFGMFKDNVYLNHWGEVMLLSYFQRVVQNKIDLV